MAYETALFFLAWVGFSALFTAIWGVLHITGVLQREDDWRPGDQPEDWWK